METFNSEAIALLAQSRGPEWHACIITLNNPIPKLQLKKGPFLLWVPVQKGSVTIDQVAKWLETERRIPVPAQTLRYQCDVPHTQYTTHSSTCTCTCHGPRRTNLTTQSVSAFTLQVDVHKLINQKADECFRKWSKKAAVPVKRKLDSVVITP